MNGWVKGVLSHPSGKNKDAARMGHPGFVPSHPRRKKRAWNVAPGILLIVREIQGSLRFAFRF
jgi:hypothetical protein